MDLADALCRLLQIKCYQILILFLRLVKGVMGVMREGHSWALFYKSPVTMEMLSAV